MWNVKLKIIKFFIKKLNTSEKFLLIDEIKKGVMEEPIVPKSPIGDTLLYEGSLKKQFPQKEWPNWANYLAVNPNCESFYFENKPKFDKMWDTNDGMMSFAGISGYKASLVECCIIQRE